MYLQAYEVTSIVFIFVFLLRMYVYRFPCPMAVWKNVFAWMTKRNVTKKMYMDGQY